MNKNLIYEKPIQESGNSFTDKNVGRRPACAAAISDALNMLRDNILAETDEMRNKSGYGTERKMPKILQKTSLIKWSAAAACLCLLAAGAFMRKQPLPSGTHSKDGITVSEDGVTIPPLKVSLSKPSENSVADMLAFFIYQGRCYAQYEWIYDNADMVGKYLGTATGLINEWTPQDGYVELAGSVRGDFYEVKGYDPSFMLCMIDETDAVSTYVCNTGITLKYGSELYEDRLHLAGNYCAIEYESRASWYYSKKEIFQLDDAENVIADFLEQLNSAEFMPRSSLPLKDGESSVFDTETYHLYFKMNNGTTVHLRLCENGYVFYQGILPVCVQIPEESYGALLGLLAD